MVVVVVDTNRFILVHFRMNRMRWWLANEDGDGWTRTTAVGRWLDVVIGGWNDCTPGWLLSGDMIVFMLQTQVKMFWKFSNLYFFVKLDDNVDTQNGHCPFASLCILLHQLWRWISRHTVRQLVKPEQLPTLTENLILVRIHQGWSGSVRVLAHSGSRVTFSLSGSVRFS